MAAGDVGELLLDLSSRGIPQGREGEGTRLAAALLSYPLALFLVREVVDEKRFKISLVVEDALLAVLPDRRHFQIARLREKQSATRTGLADAQVPFAANRAVEDDARTQQQLAVLLTVDALRDVDAISACQSRQSSQPAQAFALHRRMQIAHEEDVNVPPRFRRSRRGRGKDPLKAEQIGRESVRNPFPVQHIDSGLVGQHELAQRQEAPQEVPKELPVGGQGHEWDRPLPQPGRNGRVIEVQDDEVGPPVGREPGKDRIPIVGVPEQKVGRPLGVEGQASPLPAVFVPIVARAPA